MDIFDVFVLLRRMTLWPLPLTLWPWHCFVYGAPQVRRTYQFLLSYFYRLLSYVYWIRDHISVFWNIHCACPVSRDLWLRAKIIHIFEIPDPNLPFHFVTFGALWRRLSHVIGKNSVFPLWRIQTLVRMRSIAWPVPRRSHKPRVTIYWRRIAYSLYNFYAATMMIKGSLYLGIPMLKRFSVVKKLVRSKSVPEMAVFRKLKDENIKYSHRDPQKALPYPERRHLKYFA